MVPTWTRMSSATAVVVVGLLCTLSRHGGAFNLDTRTAVVQKGPTGSMFGFSVALLKDNLNTWTLIGAPNAQTNQPNVTSGGAVYRCTTDSGSKCDQIPFDRKGHKYDNVGGRNQLSDMKSYQWFGATVDSSKENGLVVACAPRYVYFSINYQRREPVGTCWIARNFLQTFEEYSPCRTNISGHHRQGSCQAGMSAALTQDGKRLFVGAVGSFYWQGQVFSKDMISNEQHYKTSESSAKDDDSYLGYSSAVGEFSGDNDIDVVIGMPKGSDLAGKVVLYNSTMHNLLNISGEQLGAYYGYSICVSDVNGDGLDDIIVGAPLFTDTQSKIGKYEEGRVYVRYQNKMHKFDSVTNLDGKYSKGRFGLSLGSLKDINRDGFEDFAVGAPYAGKDEKGIVYIYHGSATGVRESPSQVITPEDFTDVGFNTLGFSVSGGMDMDSNEYPDIVIGAYDSDRAIFVRSRPVVNIISSMKLSKDIISLEDKTCTLQDKTKVACVEATLCLSYNGIGVAPEIDIQYNITLDAGQKRSRAIFMSTETSRISRVLRLQKNDRYCNNTLIYIQNGIRDKLTPIDVQANYSLVDLEPYRYVLKPILNQNVPNVASKELNIEKNCGKDEICIPDLQLLATANMNQYSIGSSKRLEIDVIIQNGGEDAFESMLYVTMPLEVNYVNINKSKLDFPVSCTGAQPEITGVNELVCDVGNPLPSNKTLRFKIMLAPSRIVSSVTDLIFSLMLNSTNKEQKETLYDNEEEIILPVRVEVTVAVRGISQPETVTYNKSEVIPATKTRETEVGREVTHVYEVGNQGPSSIREAEVHILWPTYTLDEKFLLYIMAQPDVKGNAQCGKVENVNPLNLKVIRRKPPNKISTGTREIKQHTILNEIPPTAEDNREKREIMADESESRYLNDEAGHSFSDELSCGATLCTHIYCTISNLEKGEQVFFSIRSRLWRETYNEFGLGEVQTSSKLVTRVTALPYGVDPNYLPYKVFTVSTRVILEDSGIQPYTIPWWIIILAICCGLILLGLLALLLWKLGFFKRKRPQDQPEKEPLNEKNGYRMTRGDAAL